MSKIFENENSQYYAKRFQVVDDNIEFKLMVLRLLIRLKQNLFFLSRNLTWSYKIIIMCCVSTDS